MNIPLIDLNPQYQEIKPAIQKRLDEVFEKGCFILGPDVKQFEENFAAYCDAKYAVGVNSGTDALYLAMAALDITVGDEVILPTFTFIATCLCISYTGATPVFVDIEDETYNIDPEKLEAAITSKTKAIIPVHLYGQAANMDEIKAIAQKHNIKVVEDAAQAHGARYKGQRIGSLGEMACFSFYPGKGLGAFGDAGMVVTNNEEYYKKVMMLRDYGRSGKYDHMIKGYNSRLDTVQAVVLVEKLKRLDAWNQHRVEKAKLYYELLKDVDGIILPMAKDDREHVYQTFATRVENRDEVMQKLQAKGVGAIIHYPKPVHLQEAYKDAGYKKGDFPVAEKVANTELSLPMFPHITNEQVEYVCQTIKEVL